MWPSRQRVAVRFVVLAMLIHRLDRVRSDGGLGEAPVDPEAADGEHLLQGLAQGVGGVGVCLVEQPREVPRVIEPELGVGVVEGLHDLRVDVRFRVLLMAVRRGS